ncbi:alanine racemase [Pseudomonadales bacterium]|nr:alanine racemase [Pseudomonadales bacterium]
MPNNKLSIRAKLNKSLSNASVYINRAALQHNAAVAQSIAPNAHLISVIKANAYGHGMLDTAAALSSVTHGFAVARIDEALELRDNGFQQMIIVMSPALSPEALNRCAENDLTAVIHTAQNIDIHALPKHLDYWLKIDTGMHRLGLMAEELPAMLSTSNPASTTLMTHFSSAEHNHSEHSHAESNSLQMQQFNQILRNNLKEKSPSISLSNSATLLRHNDADSYQQWQVEQLENSAFSEEYIRPGIMLYGADPLDIPNSSSKSLYPAMTLAAPVLAIRQVKIGETVGYNGNWQAERESTIATIGIGYGDGYPRHAPNGTPVMIHGKRAPLTGNVSMDTISVDITDLVDQGINVQAGDTAELWGENLSANEIAKLSETIAYELFTGISQRVDRILL